MLRAAITYSPRPVQLNSTCSHLLQQIQQFVLRLDYQFGPLYHQFLQREVSVQHGAHQTVLVVLLDAFLLHEAGQQLCKILRTSQLKIGLTGLD